MAREKKERTLTEAEQRRLDHFNEVGDELVVQGYKRTDLRINMVTANVVSIVGAIALLAVCIAAFIFIHPEADLASGYSLIVLLVVFIVLIVVHELIHGFTWSRFTPNGFNDVEFGIMWNALAPYCACNAPLKKGSFILGALMPLITLGIIPLIVAFCIGSAQLLYIGALMVVCATGDILIVLKLLGHKSTATDVLLYDHPTEGGSVIFER